MANVIHASVLNNFLIKDADIMYITSPRELQFLRKLMFSNKTNWGSISSLPEFMFGEFDKMMRDDCRVIEERQKAPEGGGPNIIFEDGRHITIRVAKDNDPRGMFMYRKCLAVVAYFVGIKGGKIKPQKGERYITFSNESWILISMAARYCLMPAKLLKKIYILTKLHVENGEIADGMPLLHSFVDNLVSQTELPKWVVLARLHEHAFSSSEFSDIVRKRTIQELVEEYRKNEHYKDALVS